MSVTCAWYPHIPWMVAGLMKAIGAGQDGGLWPTAAQVVQEDGSTSTSKCSHSKFSGVCSHRRAYIGLHHCAQHTYTPSCLLVSANPSCRHITLASSVSKPPSHMVPHALLRHSSTLPFNALVPLWSLREPSLQFPAAVEMAGNVLT